MQRKLTARTIFIVAVLLLCVYGIFGLPKSLADVEKNLRRNIRLGLDLKGGSHLVLQVQVQDAAKSEAEQTMERMKEEMRKAGIDFASLDRNDPDPCGGRRQHRDHGEGHPGREDDRASAA